LKPEQWESPLVQDKYQEEKACDKKYPYRIIIIIIIIGVNMLRSLLQPFPLPVTSVKLFTKTSPINATNTQLSLHFTVHLPIPLLKVFLGSNRECKLPTQSILTTLYLMNIMNEYIRRRKNTIRVSVAILTGTNIYKGSRAHVTVKEPKDLAGVVGRINATHSLLTHDDMLGTLTGNSLPKRNFKGKLRQNFITISVRFCNQSKATEKIKEVAESEGRRKNRNRLRALVFYP
jgi:hypothetical protein